jgi:hypothetical protein
LLRASLADESSKEGEVSDVYRNTTAHASIGNEIGKDSLSSSARSPKISPAPISFSQPADLPNQREAFAEFTHPPENYRPPLALTAAESAPERAPVSRDSAENSRAENSFTPETGPKAEKFARENRFKTPQDDLGDIPGPDDALEAQGDPLACDCGAVRELTEPGKSGFECDEPVDDSETDRSPGSIERAIR